MATGRQQLGDMEEEEMQKVKEPPRRVFINNVDSYTSKYIAKLLSGSERETSVDPDEEEEEEEELESELSTAAGFQVVGTVCGRPEEEEGQQEQGRSYVLEQYSRPGRDELLSKLMTCDVVIYNITQHLDQVEEALWAASALHNNIHHFPGRKMFILVSTVMTWARSKPVDPDDLEVPFTDEIFWSRRPHPNFRQHIDVEKRVVKMGKTNREMFSTYVVASGLQYGMEEQVFHCFFKKSWLGEESKIPVFGDGKNIVPTIHIRDLASVVHSVIQHQPKPYYLLAVDSSNNTMEDMVKAVASALGPEQIQNRPPEDAYLCQDLSVMEVDSLLVDLRMEAVYIKKLFSISWLCESGLVENIEQVVGEYRHTRGLLPVRLCVLGPPAVGKTTVSKKICEHYKLHHITLKDTISETVSRLEGAVMDPDAAEEDQELLHSLKDTEHTTGVLDVHLRVLKDKLMSNPCRNQGFVLDDFPETYEQAKELFDAEDHDEASQSSSYSRRMMPELVLCLEASDTFLTDRVIDLPQSLVEEHGYEPEIFLRRLTRYRENLMEAELVTNYFIEQDISPLYLEITSTDEPDFLLLMQKIFDTVGQPRNYGPSRREVEEEEEEERRKAKERMKREAHQRSEEEQREADEARTRAARWEEWTQRLEQVNREEEELLEASSVPMRDYLMEHVMPTLVQGLVECCRVRPQDPKDFLAEFLIQNNPMN